METTENTVTVGGLVTESLHNQSISTNKLLYFTSIDT